MVDEALVRNFSGIRKVADSLIKEYGDISLFMLIPDSPNKDEISYTLFASAPWLDEKTTKEGISIIYNKIIEVFTSDEKITISRITLVNSKDDSVMGINMSIDNDKGIGFISNCFLFNVFIERAVLLVSKKLG